MSIDQSNIDTIIGRTLPGPDGQKIGIAGEVFLDDQTSKPEWTTVSTGLFGSKESFVPLAEAQLTGDTMTVPYDKDGQERTARRHRSATSRRTRRPSSTATTVWTTPSRPAKVACPPALRRQATRTGPATPGAVGRDTSGPTTDQAMTRSEEKLHVGTEKVTTGKARLRKYVETEEQRSPCR